MIKKQTKNTIEKLVRDTDLGNAKEKETLEKMVEARGNRNKQIVIARKARLDYDKNIEEMERKIIKQIRTGQKQNLMGSGSHKKISNQLKGGGVQPLKVLEILNSSGILTIDENKIDKKHQTLEKNYDISVVFR